MSSKLRYNARTDAWASNASYNQVNCTLMCYGIEHHRNILHARTCRTCTYVSYLVYAGVLAVLERGESYMQRAMCTVIFT